MSKEDKELKELLELKKNLEAHLQQVVKKIRIKVYEKSKY